MKILFCWTGVTSYMADCWRSLLQEPGVVLKVIVETADSGKEFAAAKTLHGLDYELVEKGGRPSGLKGFAPDIIFAGGWRSPTTRQMMDRYAYVPKVFCLDMPWRWSLRCVVARFALRRFVRQFDAVYVPGRSATFYARWLGFPKGKIYRKLYSVDQRKLIEAGERVHGKKRKGFLFLGRFSAEKRVDLIEKSYNRYRELGGSWSIDYYGQGGKFIQADAIPQVLAEHACLVLASAFDPWPLVILESRAAGLEVIASDRCGNCDELGAHKVPFGNVETMAHMMLSVEQGKTIPRQTDLATYDCGAWVQRSLGIAREVVSAAKHESNGMQVVEGLLRRYEMMSDDEVWVHGMWTPGKWWACIKARLRGRKLVRMTHGSLSPVYLKYGKLKKWLVGTFIERPLFCLSDRVVVTGSWEESWCRDWGLKGPFQTIDIKSFFKFPSPSEQPSRSVAANSPLHVLFLGRRHPLKGVVFLERAVEELNCKKSATALVQLRIVSDHVGEELENDWDWADVLVLPTLSENFGLVVAEALERGKRVITTDGAPAWEDQPGVVYLKGYRDGTDERRVELLRSAIREICGGLR